MQPYFFPYLGYFQLIKYVDLFVIHDDVQWIKSGWINRNRILQNGKAEYLTLPVEKASSRLSINQRKLISEYHLNINKILRKLDHCYHKAPNYAYGISLLKKSLFYKNLNICDFIVHTLKQCCSYLNINTPIILSSEIKKDNSLKAEERVLDINRILDSKTYVNLAGGQNLYNKKKFRDEGFNLEFIKMNKIRYNQNINNVFVPNLSIIDTIMFNTEKELLNMIHQFKII